MNFHSKSIGDSLLDKLGHATKVQIASAFFCPDDPLLNALKAVPHLELIVSEEFTINDPYKLELLKKARYHRDTLQLAIAETNRQYREWQRAQEQRREREESVRESRRKEIADASTRIKFD
jgi:hypothetical protein